jgi:hypothetical protein
MNHESDSFDHRLLALLHAVRDEHDESARAALNELLRNDPEARSAMARLLVDEQALIHLLRDEGIVSLLDPTGSLRPAKAPRVSRWHSLRPLTSAAAGILFGMLCTSVVFGFVAPLTGSLTLLDESFEGSSPPASKVALAPGVWRGDQAVIVNAEQGVAPVSGRRMLRFLRQDHQGKARAAGGHIADVYRLIDLRGQRVDVTQGDVVVQASASVNAIPFPEGEKFGCAISLFALEADALPERASYVGTALENEANAMARSSRTKMDRDPASWQRLATEMRLPANTDYIVVRLHISQSFDSNGAPVFTGSYADDVRVTITRRTPLP